METTSTRGPFNRSVRELNNKNNLASLKLRKELAEYDREKKFHIEHIEKNRVNTYTFLKQLQICESNLVPAYNELLQGIITRPSMTRRRTRKSAPSALGGSGAQNDTGDQKNKGFVPKLTKAQITLLQARKNTLSNHDRAEMFMKRLRDKHYEEMEEEFEDNQEPALAMSRKISRLVSLVGEDHPDSYAVEDRWAKPRGSGFHFAGRLGSIAGRPRQSEVLDCSLPALTQAAPELFPTRAKEIRISVTSPQDEDCFGRPIKRRPLELRVRELYEKLDILKKKQEERMADLPIWEKRRRWILLTKGLGAALADSDSDSDDGMERLRIY